MLKQLVCTLILQSLFDVTVCYRPLYEGYISICEKNTICIMKYNLLKMSFDRNFMMGKYEWYLLKIHNRSQRLNYSEDLQR